MSWDGPYPGDAMPTLYRCENCGAMIHEWSLDTHAVFHATLDRIELEAGS